MISGLCHRLGYFRDVIKDVVSRVLLQPALAALQRLSSYFSLPVTWGERKVQVIPNPENNFIFEKRESCRQIDHRKWPSIKLIQGHLRCPIFGTLTHSNVKLFPGCGIIHPLPKKIAEQEPPGLSSEEISADELRSVASTESLHSIPDDSGVILSDSLPIPIALPNIGNTCYLAVVAQMWLLHYEEIIRQIEPKNEEVKKLIQFMDGYKNGNPDLCLLFEVFYKQSSSFRAASQLKAQNNQIQDPPIEWMKQHPTNIWQINPQSDPLELITYFAELIKVPDAMISQDEEHLKRCNQDVIVFHNHPDPTRAVEEIRQLPQGRYRLCALGIGCPGHHWGYASRQGNWYYVNDSCIQQKTTEEVLQKSGQARMLVYERIGN